MLAERMLGDLQRQMRELHAVVAESTRAARRNRPQIWSMTELRAHYPAWSPRQISAELARRVGLRFGRGERVVVPVGVVDAIDAQLDGEAAEICQTHDPRMPRSITTTTTRT